MKFDDLEAKLRVFETAHDRSVLPEMYIVARIDGRSFTKLTKKTHSFEVPFDIRFKEYMVETVLHLMNCGFKIKYGFTQSDEISLLFDQGENAFSRKSRKLVSILAGEASAKFSHLLGAVASFDCRLSELPNQSLVVDYFRWRNEDAHRNALNAHCYWTLRKQKLSEREATLKLQGMSTAEKNEFLYQTGINFNRLPLWQKRGIGIYTQSVIKEGFNPKLNKPTTASRKEWVINEELPLKNRYDEFIINRIQEIL